MQSQLEVLAGKQRALQRYRDGSHDVPVLRASRATCAESSD